MDDSRIWRILRRTLGRDLNWVRRKDGGAVQNGMREVYGWDLGRID